MTDNLLTKGMRGLKEFFCGAGHEVSNEKRLPLHQVKSHLITKHLSGDDLLTYEAAADMGSWTLPEPVQKVVDQLDVLCRHGHKNRLLPVRHLKKLPKLLKNLSDETFVNNLRDGDLGFERTPSSPHGCAHVQKTNHAPSPHVWEAHQPFFTRLRKSLNLVLAR